ncbi:MAG: endo alpha-1,4 polygalactosaminidase [Chloroflexi bacterium]|nr:endo alpha-1,4 polygalactosaminidase [Chloroflexota bacterium]
MASSKRKGLLIGLLLLLLLLSACAVSPSTPSVPYPTPLPAVPEARGPLADIRLWAYQLQGQNEGDNLQKLADSRYDLLVIEQTRSVKSEESYDSKADVTILKGSTNSSGEKKLVVCYIDVGEAESYRWYWQKGWRVGSPEWIVAPDPDGWDENYPVKFWRQEWKNIVKEYVNRIIEDGYDGIYLDWLEVYSFEPVIRAAKAEGLDARMELIRFVRELAEYARDKKPGFLLIAQNASELGGFSEYVEVFDAIAQEAIWYEGGGDPDTAEQPGDVLIDPEDSAEYLANLKAWQRQGKPVFNVEYAQQPAHAQRAYRLGKEQGFKAYVTLRPLDALTSTPPEP